MADYNEEYFILSITNNSNYPMLDLDDDFEDYAMDFLDDEPIIYEETIQLQFGDPVPRKPKMVDFHDFSNASPVLSKKLKKVIEDMQVKNIQFVPVLIRDKNDDLIEGYHAIKVCNTINCADLKKSKYSLLTNKKICSFDKLVLDNEKLDSIPLEDRLIFAIGEKRTYVVYHISVVEKMLETAPEGMTVYRLAQWDSSAPFYDAYYEYISKI
jgi:hypothetical protein